MLSDKIFKIALLVSIAGHSIFLYGWSGFAHFFPDKRIKDPIIEVTYYEVKQNLPTKPIIKEREALPPKNFKVEKEKLAKGKLSVTKVTTNKKETAAIPSEDALKALEERSLYLDYYQSIREKIRCTANHNYYNCFRVGEIYLSFVLEFNGNLKNIELFDNKSSLEETLRRIALNSVREASPFPAFPKGLKQKQLSFNVIISFEREN